VIDPSFPLILVREIEGQGLPIHRWLDRRKAHLADNRHRAVLHNAWGIHLAVDVFSDFIKNSDGHRVFVKDVGEQHVVEDLSFIPSLNECLTGLKMESWMAGRFLRCAVAESQVC
jgi:hypothetical protein